uniref:DVL-like protein n=1 Tax=Nelumbo nucifera TaxID=4432 RepID=A0A822YCQ5_NELNU|nr:TPA_asm: hypothetical protein HUJ06_031580 [Nelumbo nucifera]
MKEMMGDLQSSSFSSSSSISSSISSSSSIGKASRRLGRRCMTMGKQQRTRFYILRRCITILLCWHAHAIRD